MGAIAKEARRPIVIMDEAGETVDSIGKGLKGQPILIQYKQGDSRWQLRDGSVLAYTEKAANCT